jgi:2-polyprenyl-3-methyl-5-hydroxy-6-metoxy-1,4-benzoquinol methylase
MSDDLAQRFGAAFDHGIWNDKESVSGPGSTLHYTSDLRSTLPGLIRALGCKSMLDAPCGDFNWMKEVDLNGIDYTGFDIVPALIANHQEKYPQHHFALKDITQDAFPKVDFVLCRDVLFHLSNNNIVRVLENFVRSGSEWLATSHYFQATTMEDVPSDPTTFRLVNLTVAPFHFEQPDYVLKDSAPNFLRRWLGVWHRSWIAKRFEG